jgi:hypothetical protein
MHKSDISNSNSSSPSSPEALLDQPPLKRPKTSGLSNGVDLHDLSIPVDGTTTNPQYQTENSPQPSYTSVSSDANTPHVTIGKAGAQAQQSPQTSIPIGTYIGLHTVQLAKRVPFDESTETHSQLSTPPLVDPTCIPETEPRLNGHEPAVTDLTRRYHHRNALDLDHRRTHNCFVCSRTNALGSNVSFNSPLDRIANDDSHALSPQTIQNVFQLLHLSVLVVVLFTLFLMCRVLV